MKILLLIFCSLVVLEFGIHVIYHAVTGKAGLYDPPFSYLKDIWRRMLDASGQHVRKRSRG